VQTSVFGSTWLADMSYLNRVESGAMREEMNGGTWNLELGTWNRA
jgi:hypothetical protein